MEPGRLTRSSFLLVALLASCTPSAGRLAAEEPRGATGPHLVVSNEVSGDLTLIDPATDAVVA